MGIGDLSGSNNLMHVRNGEILSGKIEGHIRINEFFPSYLIVLFSKGRDNYCRTPTGNTFYFVNKDPLEILSKSSSFYENIGSKFIFPFQIGFAFSSLEIVVDFEKNLDEILKNSLSRNDLNNCDKKLIFSYLDDRGNF